ncbi:MAG TPA: hypothetical protein DEH78_20995 [Solibacterales bacterium]|nr:hypothetical protein [Bryobacterales bacterium]
MRLAITTPTTWPWVRRGGERYTNELGKWMAARGHRVTLISAKPGPTETIQRDGFPSVCYRRLWHPSFARAGFLEFHAFFLRCLPALLAGKYDMVQCVTFMDTYAAVLARRFTGAPCAFLFNSLPPPVRYFRSLTLKGAVIRRAVLEVDEVISLSHYVDRYIQDRFGRPTLVIPVPITMERFPLVVSRDLERPAILFASAVNDERKGPQTLMRAFNLVKESRRGALLWIATSAAPEVRERLLALVAPEFRPDIHILGDDADLPSLYGRAAVTVLPSRWEAFGMVMVESMACGTPVAGTRDGAIPEVISDGRVGRLFDPEPGDAIEPGNPEGLARALLECMELSARPETPAVCRAHAEQYSWDRKGLEYEALYQRLIARRGKG